MNKNTLIGTVLILLTMLGMVYFNQPSPEQLEAQRRMRDSIANVELQKAHEAAVKESQAAAANTVGAVSDSLSQSAADSLKNLQLAQRYGVMAAASTGKDQVVTLSNGLLTVDINAKGGAIQRAELLDYQNYQGGNVELFNEQNNKFYYTMLTVDDKLVSTADLYFLPMQQTDSTVVMRLALNDASYIDFGYKLMANSYIVEYSISSKGLKNIIAPTTESITLNWHQRLMRQELGRTFEERYSSLFYKFNDDNADDLSNTGTANESISRPLTWIGYKNQFFSSALISNNLFRAGVITSTALSEEQDADYLKEYDSKLEINVLDDNGEASALTMNFFLGPNNYTLLSDMEEQIAANLGMSESAIQLQELVPLGWGIFGWVNAYVTIPVFNLLSSFVRNYGIIIILLTLFIKLITLPFTYKSYVSSAKMRIVSKLPEVAAINAKYPNQEDAMAKQQAMMAFYKKFGVSPMGGCVPMLFQWPVLLALFYFFPNSIELRGESFLWANDLSTYDAIITWNTNIPLISWIFGNHLSLFCLLMTATNMLYTHISMSQNPSQQGMPGMKLMTYGMPLMFFFVLNNYAAGLSLYYFVSTLLSIVQTYICRATLDDDKLLAKMQDKAKNTAKPSKNGNKKSWIEKLQEKQRRQIAEMNKQREKQQHRR